MVEILLARMEDTRSRFGERSFTSLGTVKKGEKGIGDVIDKIIAYLNTIQYRRTAMR
jgi:hypothetical protein